MTPALQQAMAYMNETRDITPDEVGRIIREVTMKNTDRPAPACRVVDRIESTVCEEVYTENGRVVGYWAYGSWAPDMEWQDRWMTPEELREIRAAMGEDDATP